MAFITTEQLTYIYGQSTPYEKTALDHVNISIEKGEIIGIMGHTGSGKSTLVQHFNGLIRPTSGRVLVDGVDIWERPKEIRSVRFRVGLVFQYPEYQLFDETCQKDIGYGPRNMGLSEQEIEERVREAAERLEIPNEILQKSPFDLSGGEKRRVAIAGVLAMRPDGLVLDEPTAGLDPQGRKTVMDLIERYRCETRAAVIFVSHSMEHIASIADRVLVMNQGKVELFDTVPNVFSQYARLKELGLNIPAVTEIFLRLKEQGIDVGKGIYTVDDGVKALSQLCQGRVHHG